MAETLKDTFKGHGSMEDFVDQSNALFKAFNDARVDMPSGYAGDIPTLSIQDGALVLNMMDAQVFTPNRVTWNLLDDSTSPRAVSFESYSVSVVNGYLTITVNAVGT